MELRCAVRGMNRCRRHANESGMVTAELAIALPILVLCAGFAAACIAVVQAQTRAQDAAREAVRLAARGDQLGARRAVMQAFPGARLQLWEQGDMVTAVVDANVRPAGLHIPAITVSGKSVAVREPTRAPG